MIDASMPEVRGPFDGWLAVSGGGRDTGRVFDRAAARWLPTIVAGDGIYLIDDRGRHLLDVCSGPFLAALGQGNERVLQAILEQGRRLTYTYSRTTRHHANAALTEQLAALADAGFERAHLTSGGSEAVEMALKFLRAHAVASGQAERHRVISLMPGYHGATLQALGLNGDVGAPGLWGSMAVYSEKIPVPLTFRAASSESAAAVSLAALEETIDRIGPGQVLAFVMEPIGGQASGVNIPHPSFARGARATCDRHGIRLVFDESVCAVRTGRFLAAHHDDANPIACAAGAAVLDEIIERDLMGHAERTGRRLRAGLDALAQRSPLIGDVRGRGLLLAIELVADKDTLARFPASIDPGSVVLRHGLDHGLLLYSRRQNSGHFGDWLLIAPPLVISPEACDDLLSALESALAAAAAELLPNHAADR
jgi:adenosylmethionine-8-amino-7-oxononanoate aminotransferase